MRKKGVVEVQFNWIFIMFAGALILIFFITIGLKYKSSAETSMAITTSDQLDTIFTSASVFSRTAEKIQLPRQKLTIECDNNACNSQGCASTFTLFAPNGEGISREISLQPIFAPKNTESDEAIILTLPWEYPFTIINLVYLIPENVRFYIHGSDPELIELGKVIQQYNLSISIYDSNTQIPKGIKGKIITTGGINPVQGHDFYLINPTAKSVRTSNGESYYFDIPTLLGLIVSDDIPMYECNMKKAFIRYDYVQEIYIERSNILSTKAEDRCKNDYVGISDDTIEIGDLSNKGVSDIKGTVNGNKIVYEEENKNLLRKSCPPIY